MEHDNVELGEIVGITPDGIDTTMIGKITSLKPLSCVLKNGFSYNPKKGKIVKLNPETVEKYKKDFI